MAAPVIVHPRRSEAKLPIAIGLAPDTTAGSGVHAQPTARLARKATRLPCGKERVEKKEMTAYCLLVDSERVILELLF